MREKMTIKYADIYDQDFLNLFKPDEAKQIKQLEFGQDNLRIDLNAIIDVLNLQKRSTFIHGVTKYDPDDRLITFSAVDSSGIRRSFLAQGIGKSIYYKFSHNFQGGACDRFALEFAHQLIMPKQLIYTAMKRYRIMASKAQEDPDDFTLLNWDQLDVNRMLTYMTHTLGVTQTMLVYTMLGYKMLER